MTSKDGYDNADFADRTSGYAETAGGKGALNNKTAGQYLANATKHDFDNFPDSYKDYKYGYSNTTAKNDKLGSSAHTDYYFWN